MSFEITEDFLADVRLGIESGDETALRKAIDELPEQDVSALLQELEAEEALFCLQLLPLDKASHVLSEVDTDYRLKLIKQFTPQSLATYTDHMDSDDAVDLINQLDVQVGEEVIGWMNNEEKADHIRDLMHYDEDCAGGLMAKELIKANLNWTVDQCIEEIRRQSKKVDKIYSIYVVDNAGKLLGTVSIKKMLLADEEVLVADLYEDKIISVESYRSGVEVAECMKKYDLETIPVINVQGKLLGRITIDDVVDFITEQADQERQLMAGITEDTDEDDSVWILAKSRLPWLFIGIIGGLLGAQFIGVFEDFIQKVTAMAFFIPLITATGGNVGIQSSSMVVQSLARDSAYDGLEWERFLKGFSVSLVNGIAIAGAVFLFNYFLQSDSTLAVVVSVALFSVVLISSFMGTITPLLLHRFGVNPALASGPFITTANDLLGIGIYFLVAYMLYTF
ncbi:MAG: magnesium transporter [Cytophagaceae bacterium]|jgi:magnesium transporter|nr:magnesium transporter [Cytophagaceae bacterium]